MIESVNVHGGSGDESRGTWCTPEWLCKLMGTFDLDPCSNERSHIRSLSMATGSPVCGLSIAHKVRNDSRVFINPPYSQGQVIKWVRAYSHTDFTFLLRWDPSTAWFSALLPHARFAWFPLGKRINFEPPPGVRASSSTMPHALYMKNEPNAELKSCGLTIALK